MNSAENTPSLKFCSPPKFVRSVSHKICQKSFPEHSHGYATKYRNTHNVNKNADNNVNK